MKKFYSIFQLFILILLILNWIIITVFWKNILQLNFIEQYSFLTLFIIIEFIIINYLVQKFFNEPIVNLELTIKKFYTWEYKNKNIIFNKTPNKNINYILSFFSKTLNTLRHIKDEFTHWKEIKWEVELWKEIQWKMLDKKLLKVPSLDIMMKSKPAWEIGWDSYDIIAQDDMYYIYVWDATWHWVWAWFIMIMVNALISWFAKIFKSWATILTKTNEILKPRVKANLLMSLLLVRWDEKEKRLFMTWAWHEYLMIYKSQENKTYKIKSGWIALWMVKDISKILKEKEIKFEKNDIIVMYSDWVTEAINKPAKDWWQIMFWEDRLIEAINKSPNWKDNKKTTNTVFNNITIELSKFMWYKHCQLDDVTLAVVHYKWEQESETKHQIISKDFITEWSW